MAISTEQVPKLKHAYQVLGVPLSASSVSIKQSFRKLVKRWHPDLSIDGTPEHAEATEMTRLINEAYSMIKNAPLRYYMEAFPPDYVAKKQAAGWPPSQKQTVSDGNIPKTDWMEYGIRFACGAVLGALMGFRFFLFNYDRASNLIAEMAIAAVVFGLLAARYGDRFWHTFLRHWWLWS